MWLILLSLSVAFPHSYSGYPETQSGIPLSPPPSALLCFLSQCRSNSTHNVLHAGDRHAVSQGFVTGGIRGGWDVCPAVRETLL